MASFATQFTRQEDRTTTDVFVVCPNSRIRMDLNDRLALPRWNVIQAGSGAGALESLQKHVADDGILLLDPNLPDLDLNEFLGIVKVRYPNLQLMTLNSHTGQLLIGGSSPTPVSMRLAELINRGVAATSKPASENDGQVLRHVHDGGLNLRGMIGDSEPMKRTYNLTRMVAARDTTVLVTGESGTGKELIAQEIHLISPRRKQPFVAVNCSAIPDALLEAELFGYVKGAFTGAVQSRIGRIHAAHGGTLFLDEVGDMPLSLQSKILRFLEQGEVQRLGGLDNLKVDVRVVAATNADLKKLISQQLFREDLYYRLAIFPIQLPPLRERMSDLEELAEWFVAKYSRGTTLTREALQMLQQHNWPGNVRELRNVIERASVLVGSGHEINPEHIFL
jgi:transcriptional regulator with GAF, ATPase, and Fis domain